MGSRRVDLLALAQRQQIHHGAAAGIATCLRHFVHLQPVHFAAVGEAQHGVVRVRDEQLLHEIFVFHRSRRFTAAAAALRLIFSQRAATSRNRLCESVTTTSCGSIRSSVVRFR